MPRPDSNHFPIIGQAALLHAGIKIHLDYRRCTVSDWVPASRLESIASAIRRAATFQSPGAVEWQGD